MEIDLIKLKKSKLSIEDFFILQLIYEESEINDYIFSEPRSDILKRLEDINYIKITDTDIIPRQELIDLMRSSGVDVSLWIEEFRSIWPAGVNSTGQSWRGDKQECIKKMKMFIKANKYTQDSIIDAANRYIKFTVKSQYRMSCDNFINKLGKGSTLLAWCQNKDSIIEKSTTGNKTFN